MTLLKSIRHERDVAFDYARNLIWKLRYGPDDVWPRDKAETVRHARQLQWNAATLYRWKVRQALR